MKRGRRRTTLAVLALPAILLGAVRSEAPVADAAQRNDLEAVRRLIREGADVNAPEGDGMTALHWASRHGNLDMAEVLIQAGANVGAGTRIGRYTPLHLASAEAHAQVVRLLLEAGADPLAATTNSGATPLHLAAASGNPEVLRLLLDAGADVNGRESSWGQTPLIFAASKNRVEAIQVLLQAGADPSLTSHAVDVVERSRADGAAEKRLMELLDEFKKQEGGGASWQPTPSQVQAAIEASREVQRNWPRIEAQDEEAQDQADQGPRPPSYAELVSGWGGLTPLLHAVRQGHREATLALLDGGADIDQPSGGDHTSALLMAALNGQFDLARLLVEQGADPNQASTAGATPLYAVLEREWAPRSSYSHPVEYQQQQTTYLEMLELLLQAGADPNARLTSHLWYMEYTFGVLKGSGIDLQGATPFWRAAYALDVGAMRLLMAYGADPGIPTMKPIDRRRPSAAPPPQKTGTKTQEGGEPAAGQKKAEQEQEAEEGDPSGLPPVPVGGPAIFPIHAASGVGYGQSFAGNAHRHVPVGWMAAVRFLVEETGADVNARDANGYTPLHHAASRGDDEMILYLVDHGADVTLLSRKGQTTADMANGPVQRVQPFPETVALLERLGSKNNHRCVTC